VGTSPHGRTGTTGTGGVRADREATGREAMASRPVVVSAAYTPAGASDSFAVSALSKRHTAIEPPPATATTNSTNVNV
jgi:hypothetical protein